MRIDLPSGAWVEVRDQLKAADRFATQNSITFTLDEGKVKQPGGLTNSVRNALLERIITEWSYTEQGIPIPSKHVAGADIIGEVMDIDDYQELSDAVEPLVQKVSWGAPNRKTASPG